MLEGIHFGRRELNPKTSTFSLLGHPKMWWKVRESPQKRYSSSSSRCWFHRIVSLYPVLEKKMMKFEEHTFFKRVKLTHQLLCCTWGESADEVMVSPPQVMKLRLPKREKSFVQKRATKSCPSFTRSYLFRKGKSFVAYWRFQFGTKRSQNIWSKVDQTNDVIRLLRKSFNVEM